LQAMACPRCVPNPTSGQPSCPQAGGEGADEAWAGAGEGEAWAGAGAGGAWRGGAAGRGGRC
jgi:hypothetical protein